MFDISAILKDALHRAEWNNWSRTDSALLIGRAVERLDAKLNWDFAGAGESWATLLSRISDCPVQIHADLSLVMLPLKSEKPLADLLASAEITPIIVEGYEHKTLSVDPEVLRNWSDRSVEWTDFDAKSFSANDLWFFTV